MKTYALTEQLWNDSKKQATYFSKDNGLVALASCVEADRRLPEEGFATHTVPEAFVVLSGEVAIGGPNGLVTVSAGTLAVIEANEPHYTLNNSGKPATLVAFSLSNA